ncbi:predicted protein [Thalassiosira pseudonana CCMP1335]|uniref:NAD-dependent epimerase/dehydratase domain-containing protein n=1 Tax=Thalassiosira pseudonana TaxID=35128 RepID=B8BRW7_THAPS|nr:predicted protein [Thalassiosira pseudonana CCMP1335]EED96613.1 predicted protein [Thalassiosira pseudonana CCMP1335]
MINLPFSRESKENAYDKPSSSRSKRMGNILGNAQHVPTTNNHHNTTTLRTLKSGMKGGGAEDCISPTSLDRNVAELGWQNHGNGVYIHDQEKAIVGGCASSTSVPSAAVFSKLNSRDSGEMKNTATSRNANIVEYSPKRKQRATLRSTNPSSNPYTTTTGIVRRHNSLPIMPSNSSPVSRYSPRNTSYVTSNTGGCNTRRGGVLSSTVKHRFILLSCAIGLALLGIFLDTKTIMNASTFGEGSSSRREWIMNLPRTISTSVAFTSGYYGGVIVEEEEGGFLKKGGEKISMQEEWSRVQSAVKKRARGRRMRTQPPSTVAAVSMLSGVKGNNGKTVESSAPRLVLDLPSHRTLDSPLVDSNTASITNTGVRRRLEGSFACGPEAREASQLNPNHYPEYAHINSNSRIVVTGALTQLGMEVILKLHEQCGVSYIMGLDSMYPNTRHDRIDMIEWRYKYIVKRVPEFQRLMVPVFGVHPHSKVGEEVKLEIDGYGFDIVTRFRPTHIVHLEGMEEGMGEHDDYGDTTDVSPFSDGSSTMMRRFTSLASIDQILTSLMKYNQWRERNGEMNRPQPKLVYVSSNEATTMSGVSMSGRKNLSTPSPATVYGTSCLLNEVMASYHHRRHGVESVGLRVPPLFGPFDRSGSLIHDLTERIVRNAAGKNVKGVPKYHADSDRYELATMWNRRDGAVEKALEQVAFVSDVAKAVVAAMQFEGDVTDRDAGPTLIRLGSKFTTTMKDLNDRMESYLPPYNQWESPGVPSLGEKVIDVAANNHALSIYDTQRNRDLLGWSHTTRLHEGTKSMLAWHVMKAYPYGLPTTVPSYDAFKQILVDSRDDRRALVNLPCASGCRWQGFCSSSAWDEAIATSKAVTASCPYVLYTVDLRPELFTMEKQSAPSQRKGWEEQFCKVAFVSSSSKLANSMYSKRMNDNTPVDQWNGTGKDGHWRIVVIRGSQYSMTEAERSLAKLTPNLLFNDRVEKAMHLEMKARDRTEKKNVVDKDKKEMRVYLPPRAHRHSVFFTNKYTFGDDFDTNSAKNLAKFVMANMGIAETSDIRKQVQFYEQTGHLTRTNMQRSANYQEFFQDNFFPYDFLRSTWLVHELKSEEGRNLRCEMYEEHSTWGNNGMEDLSMGFVLAKKKVKMQLGSLAPPEYDGPEEWYPLLVPREATDEDAITEGPVYLEYLEAAQKVTRDEAGGELFISFLPQKR